MRDANEIKSRIIEAGYKAIDELIKVSEEAIIKPGGDDDLAADKLKNAAATKKLAILDAFEILSKIESEKDLMSGVEPEQNKKIGFAERRSRK